MLLCSFNPVKIFFALWLCKNLDSTTTYLEFFGLTTEGQGFIAFVDFNMLADLESIPKV